MENKTGNRYRLKTKVNLNFCIVEAQNGTIFRTVDAKNDKNDTNYSGGKERKSIRYSTTMRNERLAGELFIYNFFYSELARSKYGSSGRIHLAILTLLNFPDLFAANTY